MLPNKGEHKFAVGEENGKQDFPTLLSLNGIHLNNTNAIANFPREINVANGKKCGIDILVDGLLIQHNFISVICTNMMDRLALTDKW